MRTRTHHLLSPVLALFGASLSASVQGETAMQLTSTAFAHEAPMPAVHTCEGRDLSPPLAWTGAPEGTRSFALIVDDPDAPDPAAPKMTWVHWVLFNIPPNVSVLPEALTAAGLPTGTVEGVNDWKQPGYRGPCPPIGRHRYVHKLYALDVLLPATPNSTKAAVEQAMAGHVLARTELIGTYQKHGAR